MDALYIRLAMMRMEGSGTPPASKTEEEGGAATIADGSALSREDCVFAGWNTAADGSGTAVRGGCNVYVCGEYNAVRAVDASIYA